MPSRHLPLRLAALLTGLILTGCASSSAKGPDPAARPQPASAAAILAALPVFPGAAPSSTQVPTAMGIPSSSYLQVASATYTAATTGHAIEAWYAAALGRRGWTRSATGYTGSRGRVTEYGESFTKGKSRLVSINLSFLPPKGGHTTFRVGVDDIKVPPRPAASLVPASADSVVIRARSSSASPWKTRVLTTPSLVHRWVATLNGLPLFPAGTAAFHCAADFGQGATLTFHAANGASLTFNVVPACAEIAAPDGSLLSAGSVWSQVQTLLHLAPAHG